MRVDLPWSASPRVSIVVVATSSVELASACLRSLARFGPTSIPFETIVVLNERGADFSATLRSNFGGVTLVESRVNLGMAGAANRGRSVAKGEFIVLLHDDAEVQQGWMEALVKTADDHPEAGAIGGKVLHMDGRLQLAGAILWRNATTSPPWIGEAPPPTAFDRVRAVDYCGTSSLLVRASVWDAIGGLEERLYPVYYVDVDLSMAVRNLGFIVMYDPRSVIRHHRGASTNQRLKMFASQRNRQVFLEKWETALTGHEEWSGSQASVERALDRAEQFAEQCRHRGPPALPPRSNRSFDADEHALRHYEANRAFQRDYVKHLTAQLDSVENALEESRRSLEAASRDLAWGAAATEKAENTRRESEMRYELLNSELQAMKELLTQREIALAAAARAWNSRSKLFRQLASVLLFGKRRAH